MRATWVITATPVWVTWATMASLAEPGRNEALFTAATAVFMMLAPSVCTAAIDWAVCVAAATTVWVWAATWVWVAWATAVWVPSTAMAVWVAGGRAAIAVCVAARL